MITTHLSAMHLQFMLKCWPVFVRQSPLLRGSDVLFYSTKTPPTAFRMLFRGAFSVKLYHNPGYQEGAIRAMTDLQAHPEWASSYDWVIRLNPDVIVKNDTWLRSQMSDPSVDGIFVDCLSRTCTTRCIENRIHTDFTVFRPRTVLNTWINITNAEDHATKLFHNVTQHGRDRWLQGTTQYKKCRVEHTDIIHAHTLPNVSDQA
jgi:hypothetical protein